MSELDVNKPMMLRDWAEMGTIKFLTYFTMDNQERIAFLITDKMGDQHLADRCKNGHIKRSEESPADIINVPEVKNVIDITKPIRDIETGNVALLSKKTTSAGYPIALVFDSSEGDGYYTNTYTADGRLTEQGCTAYIENFEPEEKWYLNYTDDRWFVHSIDSRPNYAGRTLGAFHCQEDAELFKRAKDLGI